jgi:hypothetical protein
LSAASGLATLTSELSAGEALRRGTVSLTAAQRVGPRTVVHHRLPYWSRRSARESLHGGVDALVGRGEGQPDVS